MSLAGIFSRRSGPEYHKLGETGASDPENAGFKNSSLFGGGGSSLSMPRFGRWSLKGVLAIGGGVLVLMLLAAAGHSHITSTTDDTTASTPVEIPGGDHKSTRPHSNQRKLRVLVPADEPGTNLCKMLLSSYANAFPAPIIVNWQRDFGKGDGHGFGSSHLGKIDGSLEAIESLSSDKIPEDERLSDEDLVFIIDAYDVWLQLPAEILIQRYYAEVNRANKRIAAEWHADAPGAAPAPKLDIILSTQKKCWPREKDGHATKCDILPESTLRADLYGENTDKDYEHHLHDMRPRFINSGSIMGSVAGMRRYLTAAAKVITDAAAEDKHIFSDQGVLGGILGAQEAWRKQEREINARAAKGEDVSGAKREWDASNEFGIGLDYVQDLFKPTVFEEDDGLYMVLSDKDLVANKSAEAGVAPPRIQGLPLDLKDLRSPLELAGIRDVRDADDDENPGWADVPLYTDFWSEVVTVAVHHNAHRNGMKGRRLKEWWNKNWFFPYLREIAELSMKPRPVSRITAVDHEGDKLEFYAPAADAQKSMPRLFKAEEAAGGLREADWNTLCSKKGHEAWWDEIFQDKKGWEV